MKGQVLDFSVQTNSGIISGDDQNRYHFSGTEWRDQKPPMRGDSVDFSHDNAGNALQVYRALQQSNAFSGLNSQLDKISNLNQSEENYNIVDWTVKVLKNYVNFEGRARRKEYWFFVLATMIVGIIVGIVGEISNTGDLLSGILNLALLLPSIAVAARRLHDTNRSGWWQLIALTIIGIIPLIIWLATETKQEANKWGQPAK